MEMSTGMFLLFCCVVVLTGIFLGNLLLVMDSRGWSSNWLIGIQLATDKIVDGFYREPRDYFWRWRCKRAWRYLLKHDSEFRHQEASIELMRRRRVFYAKGGSPTSPECPDIFDILEEWGFPPFEK